MEGRVFFFCSPNRKDSNHAGRVKHYHNTPQATSNTHTPPHPPTNSNIPIWTFQKYLLKGREHPLGCQLRANCSRIWQDIGVWNYFPVTCLVLERTTTNNIVKQEQNETIMPHQHEHSSSHTLFQVFFKLFQLCFLSGWKCNRGYFLCIFAYLYKIKEAWSIRTQYWKLGELWQH